MQLQINDGFKNNENQNYTNIMQPFFKVLDVVLRSSHDGQKNLTARYQTADASVQKEVNSLFQIVDDNTPENGVLKSLFSSQKIIVTGKNQALSQINSVEEGLDIDEADQIRKVERLKYLLNEMTGPEAIKPSHLLKRLNYTTNN